MNKYKLYMILGIIVLVLSVSSSFAYYIWKSTSNALVNLNVLLLLVPIFCQTVPGS